MMNETTYMKIGRVPGEMTGVTTQPQTLKIWAKSQHIQNMLVLSDVLETNMKASNKFTRKKLKLELLQTIKIEKSWKILSRPAYTYLILSLTKKITFVMLTREKAAADVNANKTSESGYSQLKSLKESLPEGFISTTKKHFVTIGS